MLYSREEKIRVATIIKDSTDWSKYPHLALIFGTTPTDSELWLELVTRLLELDTLDEDTDAEMSVGVIEGADLTLILTAAAGYEVTDRCEGCDIESGKIIATGDIFSHNVSSIHCKHFKG